MLLFNPLRPPTPTQPPVLVPFPSDTWSFLYLMFFALCLRNVNEKWKTINVGLLRVDKHLYIYKYTSLFFEIIQKCFVDDENTSVVQFW